MQPILPYLLRLSGKKHHAKWKKMLDSSQPENLLQYWSSFHELSTFAFKKSHRDILIDVYQVWINGVDTSHCLFALSPFLPINLVFISFTFSLTSTLFFFRCVFVMVWFVSLYFCWCSFVLQEQPVRLCRGSFLMVDEVRTLDFQNTRQQELPVSPFQPYDGWIGWLTQLADPRFTTAANNRRDCQMRKDYDNQGRVSYQLGLYFLCYVQILADLSTCSTVRDRLRPGLTKLGDRIGLGLPTFLLGLSNFPLLYFEVFLNKFKQHSYYCVHCWKFSSWKNFLQFLWPALVPPTPLEKGSSTNGCDTALPASLCWSSGIFFPRIRNTLIKT